MNLIPKGLYPQDLFRRTNLYQWIRRLLLQVQQTDFSRPFGVTNPDPKHEPIQLSFRQSVDTFLFDRVLGCQNDKRARQG